MIGRCSYRVVWPSKYRNNIGRWCFPSKAKPEIRCTEGVTSPPASPCPTVIQVHGLRLAP